MYWSPELIGQSQDDRAYYLLRKVPEIKELNAQEREELARMGDELECDFLTYMGRVSLAKLISCEGTEFLLPLQTLKKECALLNLFFSNELFEESKSREIKFSSISEETLDILSRLMWYCELDRELYGNYNVNQSKFGDMLRKFRAIYGTGLRFKRSPIKQELSKLNNLIDCDKLLTIIKVLSYNTIGGN